MVDPVARTVRQLLAEAAVHEHGNDEQHHGRGDLGRRQNGASPAAAPPAADRVAALDDARQVRARRLNRRY
jgi:hypothetical protein